MLAEIITNDRDFADIMYLIGAVLAALACIAQFAADKIRSVFQPGALVAGAVFCAELGLLAG